MNWREKNNETILNRNWNVQLARERQVRAFVVAAALLIPTAALLAFSLRYGLVSWGFVLITTGAVFGFAVRRSSRAITERYGAVAVSMTLVAGWASILWVGCNSGLMAFATLLSWRNPVCSIPAVVADPANTSLIAAFFIGAAVMAFFAGYRQLSPTILLASGSRSNK